MPLTPDGCPEPVGDFRFFPIRMKDFHDEALGVVSPYATLLGPNLPTGVKNLIQPLLTSIPRSPCPERVRKAVPKDDLQRVRCPTCGGELCKP